MKTKSYILFIISTAFLLSCNQSNKEKNANPEVVIADTVFEPSKDVEDSPVSVKNKSMLWQVDETKGLKLKKPEVPGVDTMAAQNLIQLINNNPDSIHLIYVKTSHDTIYVHIPHSEMLTERIGSTGAEIYMASTTWSLTELKGIKYVNYDFEEGDHASPGVYNRNNFKNFE